MPPSLVPSPPPPGRTTSPPPIYCPDMANADLIDIFSQIANILDIKGEDGFRVNAYRRAARALEDLTQDIAELCASGGLKDVPGIGKAMCEKIEQFVKTGKLDLHVELLASVAAG